MGRTRTKQTTAAISRKLIPAPITSPMFTKVEYSTDGSP